MNKTDVFVVGCHSTPFGRRPNSSLRDLTREAYLGVLSDAGLANGQEIEAAWFGNCLMHMWGQPITRGNMCFIPLVRDGLFPDRAPIINVEGGCATGSLALSSAVSEIRAGGKLALAIGVEKLYDEADPSRMLSAFSHGMDLMTPNEWMSHYQEIASTLGHTFNPGPDRTAAMDTYALQALLHMKQFGTTVEQIAYACAKNHNIGALNPNAQYRFTTTPEAVLADRLVTEPLTRSMCAPLGDGAAAVLVCSGEWLQGQPPEVRARAVAIRGVGLAGGKYRALDELGLSHTAATRAYAQAGITAKDIDLAEVHDATSFCEIYQCEMLGLCAVGEGGPFVASGATTSTGETPVNVSGGLVSKGHPLGATGLSMCTELVTQLRGEAGPRQIGDAAIGVQENGGGVIGLEEALAAVIVYERV